MPERSHLSIGEVLSLLREEFPDVTISKIRFLESQGLVDPERTPSGYRKFYDHDVERLRWILRQQRENFLPLKVIRGRLSASSDDPAEGDPVLELGDVPDPADDQPGLLSATPDIRQPVARVADAEANGGGTPEADPISVEDPGAGYRAPDNRQARRGGRRPRPALSEGPGDEAPATYTIDELAAAVGSTPALVGEMADYGLLRPEGRTGSVHYYGLDALAVAITACRFADRGVEPRHLRAWRNSADREAGLFEQLVLPLLRQRNPEAREQAVADLAELEDLGGQLRAALVHQALRDIRL